MKSSKNSAANKEGRTSVHIKPLSAGPVPDLGEASDISRRVEVARRINWTRSPTRITAFYEITKKKNG